MGRAVRARVPDKYMENETELDKSIKELSEQFREVKQEMDQVSPVFKRQGMPYEEKFVLKKKALHWLLLIRQEHPEVRSMNLYLSNTFGYETVKVFTNPENR